MGGVKPVQMTNLIKFSIPTLILFEASTLWVDDPGPNG